MAVSAKTGQSVQGFVQCQTFTWKVVPQVCPMHETKSRVIETLPTALYQQYDMHVAVLFQRHLFNCLHEYTNIIQILKSKLVKAFKQRQDCNLQCCAFSQTQGWLQGSSRLPVGMLLTLADSKSSLYSQTALVFGNNMPLSHHRVCRSRFKLDGKKMFSHTYVGENSWKWKLHVPGNSPMSTFPHRRLSTLPNHLSKGFYEKHLHCVNWSSMIAKGQKLLQAVSSIPYSYRRRDSSSAGLFAWCSTNAVKR